MISLSQTTGYAVEAVEPERPGSHCLLGLAGCSDATPCPMHAFWKKEWRSIRPC